MAYLGRRGASAALTSADIPDNSITAAKIVDATILAGDLAPNSVDSSELVDGSIDTSHIGDLQVTAAKVAADVATQAELDAQRTNSSITTLGTVTAGNLSNSALVYPTGHVIQTLSSVRTGSFSTTNSGATAVTDLDVDITPKFSSSKILVIASLSHLEIAGGSSGDALTVTLYRTLSGDTIIASAINLGYGMSTLADFGSSLCKLDSPATTSSINYFITVNSRVSGTIVRVDYHAGGSTAGSSIIAMEIAQ